MTNASAPLTTISTRLPGTIQELGEGVISTSRYAQAVRSEDAFGLPAKVTILKVLGFVIVLVVGCAALRGAA